MILQADPTQPASASRPWRFFVLTSLLAAVLGLSLITLRPTATAQEGVDQLGNRTSKKDSSAKKKRQKKARDEARAAASLDAPTYSDPATAEADRVRANEALIQMDLTIYELAHEELEVAETGLGDFLQETSRECRAEDHVIIADYTQEQLQGMLQRLNKEPGVEILSRPKVMTPSDQEARIQVSSLIPLVVIDETVNGKKNSRVESLNAGIELSITPHLHPGHKVALEIVLERARVQPGNKAAYDDKALPVLKRRKVQLDTEVLLGETVVIAEQARTSKGEKPGPILLLVVTPTQPAGSSQGSPNTTAQLAFRGKEGMVRVEAIEREAAQMQLAVQRGLEWLRKHQAGDQADEIERIAHPQSESTIKLVVQLLKQHDGQKLAEELEQQARNLRLRRLEMESASYRDGVQMLHRENDALRKQVAHLQQKLIDAQMQLAWLRDAATAEGREKVSDEAFLRRVYLDLMGVPPTVEEANAFLNDKDAEKRSKLIDRLLPSDRAGAIIEQTWKNLLGQRSAAKEPAANPAVAEGKKEERIVKIFALQDTPAERVIDVIKQLQQEGRTKIELHAMAQDPRTNSIIVSGSHEELVVMGNVIAALDKAASPPAEKPRNNTPDELTQRLNALDVREAEINLRAAQANLERVQTAAKSSPTAIPQQEVTAAQFEAEKAALTLESIKSGGDPLVKQKFEVRLAEVRLRAAQTHLERLTTIVKEGGATQLEHTAATFEVEKAAIELERAKARLEAAQEQAQPRSR